VFGVTGFLMALIIHIAVPREFSDASESAPCDERVGA
jgi:hypothetical protein